LFQSSLPKNKKSRHQNGFFCFWDESRIKGCAKVFQRKSEPYLPAFPLDITVAELPRPTVVRYRRYFLQFYYFQRKKCLSRTIL
jgi:hypothetical protein